MAERLEITPFVYTEEFALATRMIRFKRLRTYNPGSIKISYQAEVSTTS